MATFLDGAVYNPRLNTISLKGDKKYLKVQADQKQQEIYTVEYITINSEPYQLQRFEIVKQQPPDQSYSVFEEAWLIFDNFIISDIQQQTLRPFIQSTPSITIIEVQDDSPQIQHNQAKPRIPPSRRKLQNNDTALNQQGSTSESDQQKMKAVTQINGLSVANQVKSCLLGILVASINSVQNQVINAGKLIFRGGGKVCHTLISVVRSVGSRISQYFIVKLAKIFVIAFNPVQTVVNCIMDYYKMIRNKFETVILAENNAAIFINNIEGGPLKEQKQYIFNRTQNSIRLLHYLDKLRNKQNRAVFDKLISLTADFRGKTKQGELRFALSSGNFQLALSSPLDHKMDSEMIESLQTEKDDRKKEIAILSTMSDVGINELGSIKKASGLPVVSGALDPAYADSGLVLITDSQKQETDTKKFYPKTIVPIDAAILQKQKEHSIYKANIRYYNRENLVMKQHIGENNKKKVESILMELPEVAGEIYMHITNNNLIEYERALDDILKADNYDLEIAEITKVVIKVTLQIQKVRNEVDAYQPTICKLELSREEYNQAK